MTDETKKLFDAPWRSNLKDDYVEDAIGFVIAKCLNNPITNCISHLPELYEELKSSSYDYCWSCLATLGIDAPTADELIENLCPIKPSCCGYNNRWKLLQKVRDGE